MARGVAHIWPHLPPRYAASTLTSTHICPPGMPGILGPTKSTHKYSPVLPSAPLVCPLYSSLAPRQHHPSPSAPPAQVSPRQQPCYPDEGSVALIIISSMASTTSSPCTCAATRDASTHFEFGANILNYGSFWKIQHPDTDTHYFLTGMCCDSQLLLDNDL